MFFIFFFQLPVRQCNRATLSLLYRDTTGVPGLRCPRSRGRCLVVAAGRGDGGGGSAAGDGVRQRQRRRRLGSRQCVCVWQPCCGATCGGRAGVSAAAATEAVECGSARTGTRLHAVYLLPLFFSSSGKGNFRRDFVEERNKIRFGCEESLLMISYFVRPKSGFIFF